MEYCMFLCSKKIFAKNKLAYLHFTIFPDYKC